MKANLKLAIVGNELKSCEIDIEVETIEELTAILRVLGLMVGTTK